MVFNTSYYDKEITAEINRMVGKPYSIWKRLKLGGIGSMRMIVDEHSVTMEPYLKKAPQHTFSNIELRPNGILIHLNNVLKVYTWAIPFDQLDLRMEKTVSIHDGEHFLTFRDGYTHNRGFLEKIIAHSHQ